jgi:hypothetical protein
MTATAPSPVANRIASHFAPPLPTTPEERQRVWADALAAAMLFYQRQLASPIRAEAAEAARAVFDLEKTRLRHGRPLAGAANPPEPEVLPPLEPLYQVKACEQTLDAAVKVGAFEEEDEEEADLPPGLEGMTDDELADAYERHDPNGFATVLAMVKEEGARAGRPCDDARVRATARRFVARKLGELRAGRPASVPA